MSRTLSYQGSHKLEGDGVDMSLNADFDFNQSRNPGD
jgi:hypothetical protein